MKTKIIFMMLLMSYFGFAQNGINYKAVIKDGLGNVIGDQTVTMQFTLLEGATNVYQETHSPTTDSNGIAIVNIGEGTTTDDFNSVNWSDDDHFLKVEVDILGGTTFVNMGITQFKSVPYAITANEIELPFFGRASQSGATFHAHNDFSNGRYGLAGSVGTGAEILPANNAGVLGVGNSGHGVYGVSKTSFFAGVQGVSESVDGVGVQGYAFGGGVGGHFYTTSTGVAALTTGRGNVGFGIDEPEMKVHVGGDLFIQTNLGELVMGFPNNGNQWQLSTRGQGEDLQFQSKPTGTNSFLTKFRMRQDGELQIGEIGTPTAWTHILNNSSINKPHLKLEEVGNDFARLELTNDANSGSYWHVAGLPSTVAANAKLNFYFRNADGAADRMTITGEGKVGVNTANPSARLTINQASQSVGTGLSFKDNTANEDWHITHGFALRFHYGANLRGFINATTGAYVQSSDASLKSNVQNLPMLMERLKQLRPTTYQYKSDTTQTRALGFIAQEVQSIFPEVVYFSEPEGLYGIDYAAFGVIAIKAIQEQQTIIENQQKQIDELKSMVNTLINKN